MDSDKVLLRKYEDDLNISGMGVIILGAWGILKLIILIFTSNFNEIIKDFSEEEKNFAVWVITGSIVVVLIICALVLILHLYIGLNATKAAKGRDHKKGYYVWSIIMLVISVLGFSTYVFAFTNPESFDTTIASMIFDATTIYVFWTVIRSTKKIKEIKSKLIQE